MQVIALVCILDTLRGIAFAGRMKAHHLVGVSRDTLERLARGRGADAATAEKFIEFARTHVAPNVVGITHAGRVYYSSSAMDAVLAENAELRTENEQLRRRLWNRAHAMAPLDRGAGGPPVIVRDSAA